MTNKTRKQRGGVATPTRRNVRQRKLSAKALQNKRQNTYLLEQKQQETQRKLQKQLEKEEKELKKAAARASARLQFTNEDLADQSAELQVIATDPRRSTALPQPLVTNVIGTEGATGDRGDLLLPNPTTQLKYAIQLASAVLSNKTIIDVATRTPGTNPDVDRLVRVAKRLNDYVGGDRDWNGKVPPPTWKCWICGAGPVINHEAEHVISMFEATSYCAIFSRAQGKAYGGMSCATAIDIVNNLKSPDDLTNQVNVPLILQCTMLIAEMMPSDRCCNQSKLNELFYKGTTVKEPYVENINKVLESVWDAVFKIPKKFHDCKSWSYKKKLTRYQYGDSGKNLFIKERGNEIVDILKDICDVINHPKLFGNGIQPALIQVVNLATSTMSATVPSASAASSASAAAPLATPSSPISTAPVTSVPPSPPKLLPQFSDIVQPTPDELSTADTLTSFFGGSSHKKGRKYRQGKKGQKNKKGVKGKKQKTRKQSQRRTGKTRKMNRKK